MMVKKSLMLKLHIGQISISLKQFLFIYFFAGFLSWFRNGLLATGIGVIAFAQSEVGREAGYGTVSFSTQ